MDTERPYADRRLVTAGVICLIGIAVTHLLDISHKVEEASYVAVLFGLLITASLVLAALLVGRVKLELTWLAAGSLAFGGIVGYVYSRTIGLPGLADHVGHWRDSVGTASLLFEALLVGLSLPALRVRAVRFAPAASLLAGGLVAGAIITGQADAGHGHGGGHHGGGHAGINIDTASPGQQAEGRAHLRQALASARRRFPSFDAARAAGYEFLPRTYEQQKDLDFWHLTNRRHQDDEEYVDPRAPESLMYWKNPGGKPVLVAYIYRVPRTRPNPELGGPLFTWHLHRNSKRRLGKRKMTHLWLTDDLRSAFSSEMPLRRLARKYGTPEEGGSGAGV